MSFASYACVFPFDHIHRSGELLHRRPYVDLLNEMQTCSVIAVAALWLGLGIIGAATPAEPSKGDGTMCNAVGIQTRGEWTDEILSDIWLYLERVVAFVCRIVYLL